MRMNVQPCCDSDWLPPPSLPLSHPCAVVGHAAAAGQAGVKIRDAVGATHRSVLVDLTAAVHVAATGQVSLRHGQSRPADRKQEETQMDIFPPGFSG